MCQSVHFKCQTYVRSVYLYIFVCMCVCVCVCVCSQHRVQSRNLYVHALINMVRKCLHVRARVRVRVCVCVCMYV
jgi:hypothetical protein